MIKTIRFLFVLTISVAVFTLSSCSEGPLYSCDPEVEAWTKEQVRTKAFSSISREDLVNLPFDRQIAIYSSFSGEQKVSLWHDKLQLLLNDGNLSDAEKSELTDFYSFFEPWHFNTKRGMKACNAFIDNWVKKMEEEYHWDIEKLFWATYTWMSEEEYDNAVRQNGMLTLRVSTRDESSSVTCECTTDYFCRRHGQSECKAATCDKDLHNCGPVLTSSCWGKCVF